MSFYLTFLAGFLIGGIPFGLFAGYVAGVGDIRTQGSKNIGATNVWRIAGPGWAVIPFVGDIGKGAAAVLLSRLLYQPASWPLSMAGSALAVGIAAVLGHTFSPYLRFRGGKGVNTALGVFAALTPRETVAALIVFLIMLILFRYISLASMIAAIAFAAIVWIERFALDRPIETPYLVCAILVPALILFTHRGNIERLIQGTEPRFQLRKASS